MAREVIQVSNLGPNESNGDDWTDVARKAEANFIELYAGAGVGIQSTVTTDTTLLGPSNSILVDATAGPIVITLPPAATGKSITIKKIDSTANIVTIDGNESETIDGELTAIIQYQNSTASLGSNGTNWFLQ